MSVLKFQSKKAQAFYFYITPLLMVCLWCLIAALITIVPDSPFTHIFTGNCDEAGSGATLLQGTDGQIHSGYGGTMVSWAQNIWSSIGSISIPSLETIWSHGCSAVRSLCLGTFQTIVQTLESITESAESLAKILIAKILNLCFPEWVTTVMVKAVLILSLFVLWVIAVIICATPLILLGVIVRDIQQLVCSTAGFIVKKLSITYWSFMAALFCHPIMYKYYWRYCSYMIGLYGGIDFIILLSINNMRGCAITAIRYYKILLALCGRRSGESEESEIYPLTIIYHYLYDLRNLVYHGVAGVGAYIYVINDIISWVQQQIIGERWRVIKEPDERLVLFTIKLIDGREITKYFFTSVVLACGTCYCVIPLEFVMTLATPASQIGQFIDAISGGELNSASLPELMRVDYSMLFPPLWNLIEDIQWTFEGMPYFGEYFYAGLLYSEPNRWIDILNFSPNALRNLMDFCHVLGQFDILVQYPGLGCPGVPTISSPIPIFSVPEGTLNHSVHFENFNELVNPPSTYTTTRLIASALNVFIAIFILSAVTHKC